MILSTQAIIDFKKAYYQDFGKKVDDSMAQELGVQLLEFFALVYKAIPKEVKLSKSITKQNKYETNNK